jgi:hydroxymethylbilane synthase
VAIETRSDDQRVNEVVARVNDAGTMAAVSAERALVEALGGGCQMPIAALATVSDDDLTLEGLVSSLDGSRAPRVRLRGAPADPEALGCTVAERLVAAGAADILEEVRRMQPPASDPS